jgi:hypothetical protein
VTDPVAGDDQVGAELPATGTRPVRPGTGWPAAVAAAAARTAGRPGLWPFALLAFLVRGGIIVMFAPIVAVPTFVGLANLVSPTSVTAAGPTPRLVVLIVVGMLVVVVAIVVGTIVAAASEATLHRATVAAESDDPGSALLPSVPAGRRRTAILSVTVVRLVLLVPVLLTLGLAAPTYVSVAYQELLLPTAPAVPFPVRVIVGAMMPSVLLGITWLLGEIIGGLAARRVVLLGQGIARSLASAVVDIAAAPLTAFATLVLGLAGGVAVLVPGLVATSLAWGSARDALIDSRHLDQVLGSTLLLAAAWTISMLLAALGATWRASLWTAELVRRPRLPGNPRAQRSDPATVGAPDAESATDRRPSSQVDAAVRGEARGRPRRHWYTPPIRRRRPSVPSRRIPVRG